MNTNRLLKLQSLIDTYIASRGVLEKSGSTYQESEARSEFIDPLLELLGWDVSNSAGLIFSARQVLREESQRNENSSGKRPDYTIRIAGQKKFFIEAKKPSVDIVTNKSAIFQARSYGYTAGHPIVVLINFRDISIFDTTARPNESDPVDAFRLFTSSVSELSTNFDKLLGLIGIDAVTSNNWYDQFNNFDPNSQAPVSKYLIERISNWKIEIAVDVLSRSPNIDSATLEFLVQKLINRLLFMRMCEDRGIEGEKFLTNKVSEENFDVLDFFKKLDDRYNSGLFSRKQLNAEPGIFISGQLVKSIVEHLYTPYSPFSFSVMGVELLGLVYEYSLTEHLLIDPSSTSEPVKLVKKDEYLRRDVVTTPQELVDITVANGFSHLNVQHPKVLDFAIGSGRFLISAYNHCQNQIIEKRFSNPSAGSLEKIGVDRWKLPFADKCKLLSECFFGIDVDSNAVEVAKFSLLVNLLEDENSSTLPTGQKILPNLDQNIVHGNTLVSSLPGASMETLLRTVPFDMSTSGMPAAFDFVTGNPPYMKTEDMKTLNLDEYQYLKSNYKFTHKQFDKYMPFMEFAIEKLSEFGVAALIVPNKFLTNVSGKPVRATLLNENRVLEIANFKHVRVFEDKDTYICSLVLGNNVSSQITYSEPKSFLEYVAKSGNFQVLTSVDFKRFSADTWILPANAREAAVLDRIALSSIKMDDVVEAKNGIQTSSNEVFILRASEIINNGSIEIEFSKGGQIFKIEKAILKPYLDNSRLINSDRLVTPDSFIVYPYEKSSIVANTSGYQLIPLNRMKNLYPLAFKYLNEFKVQLQKRSLAQGSLQQAFYEFGRIQAVGTAPLAPKIFYSNNQRGDKYGLDESGIVYSSGGTAGEVALYPKLTSYSLDFILALLDQTPIEFFLRKSGSPFQGGYYSRGTAVIKEVPVPQLDFTVADDVKFHDEVAQLTREIRQNIVLLETAPPAHLSTIRQSIVNLRSNRSQLFLNRWGLTALDIEGLL